MLLDLSAAFDMVDHQILINRLTSMFGISGCALTLIRSYLTGRFQRVKVGELRSDPVTLHFGVPQGSVLGPILFNLYTCPLGQIFKAHGLMYHLYADDSLLYLSFKPNTPGAQSMCLEIIENCIEDIRMGMTLNMLKLNDDKTEFIILGTRQQLAKLSDVSLRIGNTTVLPVDCVCNLGFFLNRLLKNSNHINRLTAGLFNQLRNISRIQPRITYQSVQIIVQLLVLSKLDYCNSLLAGTANIYLDKLQLIQNMACRVIFNLCKYDHVSDQLKSPYWLKICERIVYKIACLIYNCMHGLAPQYLISLLPSNPSKQTLRSSKSSASMCLPRICRTPQVHQSSFQSIGPWIWASLPETVRRSGYINEFRSKLKTHLFTISHYK